MIAADLKPLARPIAGLKLLPGNPRQGNVEAVARSLDRFGQRKPIVVTTDDVVIAGNHTLMAAQSLGWADIAVVVVDGDDAEAKAYALADNRVGDLGGYDEEALVAMLADVADADTELLAALGWSDDELTALLAPQSRAMTDPDAVPPMPVAPVTRLGDEWLLGRHRLLCGDATSDADRALLLRDEHAALIVTSPPYGAARDYDGSADLRPEALATFLAVYAAHADVIAVNLGILRRDREVVPYWDDYLTCARRAGLLLLSWNVWDRGMPWSVAQQTAMFPVEHEWVLVFGAAYAPLKNHTVPNKTAGHMRDAITNRQADGTLTASRSKLIAERRALGTIFRSPPQLGGIGDGIDHPAVFPVTLPTAYIEACTDAGEVVVDPFGGSGSTLIAAHLTGRIARLIEIAPGYCDVICTRYQQHTGELPVLASTGEAHDFNG